MFDIIIDNLVGIILSFLLVSIGKALRWVIHLFLFDTKESKKVVDQQSSQHDGTYWELF